MSPLMDPSSPGLSIGSRLFGRGNKSKSSLLAAPSTTSLVTPEAQSVGRRRHSSSAASSTSRPYLDAVSNFDGTGSFHSRHSETSEDGTGSAHRDRSHSLIRIDEDGPAHSSRPARHTLAPPPSNNKEPVEGGTGPRRRASMRIRPSLRREKKSKEEKKDKVNRDKIVEDAEVEQKSECVVM